MFLGHHFIFGLFLRGIDVFLSGWLLHLFRDEVKGDTLLTLQSVLLEDLLKCLSVLETISHHLLDLVSLFLVILDALPTVLDR
jgi:hypothetical protein